MRAAAQVQKPPACRLQGRPAIGRPTPPAPESRTQLSVITTAVTKLAWANLTACFMALPPAVGPTASGMPLQQLSNRRATFAAATVDSWLAWMRLPKLSVTTDVVKACSAGPSPDSSPAPAGPSLPSAPAISSCKINPRPWWTCGPRSRPRAVQRSPAVARDWA